MPIVNDLGVPAAIGIVGFEQQLEGEGPEVNLNVTFVFGVDQLYLVKV